MPALGADMEDGVLVEWLVGPGDAVARGDVVAVVETDKGAIEIEAYEAGVVERLLEPVGARVAVGRPIARLAGAAAPAPGRPAPPPEPAPAGVRASPAARRAAAARGVELGGLAGSGPGGAITVADVERAADGGPPAPDRAEALRRATGALMARAKREIPHYYLLHTIDAGPVTDLLRRANEGRAAADRLVLTPFLVRAIALAARDVPEVNGHWIESRFAPAGAVHVGLAVALRGGGVVAPAVRDAGEAGAEELMARVRAVVERARSGVIRSSDAAEATITLTALGERSVEAVHGVIHPPQVALVGAGSVVERPWVVDGRLEARPVLTLTLAGDHRVSDGRRGGRFLRRMEALLARPELL